MAACSALTPAALPPPHPPCPPTRPPQSQQALQCDRKTDQGLKESAKYFQAGVGFRVALVAITRRTGE